MTSDISESSNSLQLTLNDLRFFLCLYECGSLTDAALTLGWSLSSASRTLKKLRESLGDPLFIRSVPKLIATSKTESLIPEVRHILQYAQGWLPKATFEPVSLTRTFHIAAVDNAIYAVLRGFLQAFVKAAPSASIEFVHLGEHTFERLDKGELDGAVCPSLIPLPSNYSFLNLYPVTFSLCMRVDHPLAKRYRETGCLSLKDISHYRKIAIANHIAGTHQFFRFDETSFCGKVVQETAITVPYFVSVPAILQNTDLTVTLPTQTAKRLCEEMTGIALAVLPIPNVYGLVNTPQYFTRFIWHHRTNDDPGMQWFRSLLAHSTKCSDIDPP